MMFCRWNGSDGGCFDGFRVYNSGYRRYNWGFRRENPLFSGENSLDGLRTPNTQLSQCKQCELSLKKDVIMSYAICLRKSRADAEAEARGEGETLARHERTLKDWPCGTTIRSPRYTGRSSPASRYRTGHRCDSAAAEYRVAATPEEKNKILHSVVSRVVYTKNKRGYNRTTSALPRGNTRPSREIKKAAVAFSATTALSSCFHFLFPILFILFSVYADCFFAARVAAIPFIRILSTPF